MICLCLLAVQLWGAEPPNAAATGSPDPSAAAAPAASPALGASASTNADDLKQLRERIAKQEEEIKRLQQSVEEQRALLEKAVQSLPAAGTANTVNVANTSGGPVALVPAVNVGYPRQHETTEPKPSPLSISIGNTTFTPLGFVDATFFARSTNVGSGIGTNFGGIPFNTSATDHISEANFSTQNSRIGFRVDSTVLGGKVLGYFEADFLGQPAPSVFISSNSDTFRMRNIFVDWQKDGFEILGGQDWSFMTPNRKGLSPVPSDIFFTQDMDTNYQAGLVWSRQTQFRFIAHPTENFAFGVSLENPQQYGGGGNGSTAITVPTPYAALTTNSSQVNVGTSVTSSPSLFGGVSVPNVAPDIIFKAAYDGHPGDKLFHVEAAGLVRNFKIVTGNGSSATPFTSANATAFSGEFNTNLEIVKNFRLIENLFWGEGNGRYIFGQAPDFIITANGGISPIHSGSTVDGFEATIKKNSLLYAYYGGIFINRDVTYLGTTTAGRTTFSPFGYGYSGSSQNRAIQEGTIGLVQTFWKNPSYGALSLITQYSYLTRNPWSVAIGAPKAAHTNMVWIDLRYTLP